MASATVVGATGASLLLLNVWTGPGKAALAGAFDKNANPAATKTAHAELVKIGAAVLFVGAATLIAGQSQQWGNAALAVIAALFLLWAMHHYAGGGAGSGGLNGFMPGARGTGGPSNPPTVTPTPGGPVNGLILGG